MCASPYYEDDTFVPDDAVTFLVCGALNGTAGNPDGKITQTNTLDDWLHVRLSTAFTSSARYTTYILTELIAVHWS